MSITDTLLSYLVPKLTSQVENAATDGLGYILEKSELTLKAFNGLLREGGFGGKPIVSVETQVAYEDGSRPDMAGYDEDDLKRLLVGGEVLGSTLGWPGESISRTVRRFWTCDAVVHRSPGED